MVNELVLNVYWSYVLLIYQNGVILGYWFFFQQEDGGLVVWNVIVGFDVYLYMFINFEIFQIYLIQILVFIIKGEGLLSVKVYYKIDGFGKWKN